MAGPACAGPLGQIEPTIATVDDTAVPDRLSISCHLLAVQIGCSLSAQQVPLCLTLERVSRPFLRVTFFKASWAGTADSRRRRRQYLFSGAAAPECGLFMRRAAINKGLAAKNKPARRGQI